MNHYQCQTIKNVKSINRLFLNIFQFLTYYYTQKTFSNSLIAIKNKTQTGCRFQFSNGHGACWLSRRQHPVLSS